MKQKRIYSTFFICVLLLILSFTNTFETNIGHNTAIAVDTILPNDIIEKETLSTNDNDVTNQVNDISYNEENSFITLQDSNNTDIIPMVRLPRTYKSYGLTSLGSGFISTWDTVQSGTSNSSQIQLPLEESGTYNFTVAWGDGLYDNITVYNQTEVNHTYGSPGIYTINITGIIIGWNFNYGGDCLKIIEISQWGDLQLGNSGSYFAGTTNLVLSTTAPINLNGTTTLSYMFANSGIASGGNLDSWNTSQIVNMQGMFYKTQAFNQPLNKWNVSKVTNMNDMFHFAYKFNQDLDKWKTSSLSSIRTMFNYASAFNGNISTWDVSKVTTMYVVFGNAQSFNQSINDWDVSSVTFMYGIFSYAYSFNQPLDKWDVSSVTNMMFMFDQASKFNQPLNNWDVSKVTTMNTMFQLAYAFNQPLDNWDVSKVTDMSWMFNYVSKYNYSLGAWDVSSVTDMTNMFQGVHLSTTIYNNILESWSQQTLRTGVSFSAGISKYGTFTRPERQYILDTYHWSITDGGLDSSAIQESWFISEWNTSLISSGSSNNSQVKLPLLLGGNYNFAIEWGDGFEDVITSYIQAETTHTYKTNGTYIITINGTISGWQFDNSGDKFKMLDILQWGSFSLGNQGSSFYGASNLVISTSDTLNLTGITNLNSSFRESGIGSSGNLNAWDVSQVTNMEAMFQNALNFDQALYSWNISSVTSMKDMLVGVTLSITQYDNLLIAWSQLNVQDSVTFHAGDSRYSDASTASTARQILINIYNWNITDGGFVEFNPPVVSSPGDLTFKQGTTGHSLSWILSDKYPGMYEIFINGIVNTSGLWTNGSIDLNLDTLVSNVYNISIKVQDIFNNSILDTVFVTVLENVVPDLNSPLDLIYESGTTGHFIYWSVGDTNPGIYNVTVDGSIYITTYIWANGTITVNVDDLAIGSHNFTIFLFDNFGNFNTDTVFVTVKEPVTSTSEIISTSTSTTSEYSSTSSTSITISSSPIPLDWIIFGFVMYAWVLIYTRKRQKGD